MKFRSLRRAGALLLALALACSMLTLPAAAITGPELFYTPSTVRLTENNTKDVEFQLRSPNFIWIDHNIEWVCGSGIISASGKASGNVPTAVVTAHSSGTTTLTMKITMAYDDPDLGLEKDDVLEVPCTVVVTPQVTAVKMPGCRPGAHLVQLPAHYCGRVRLRSPDCQIRGRGGYHRHLSLVGAVRNL